MSQPAAGVGAPTPPKFVLRLLRIDFGQAIRVRTLSSTYGGILTHFHAGRGHYCRGDDCPANMHRLPAVWKGCFAGEAWDPALELWAPFSVEITESSELDLRGRFGRGQVWRFERPAKGAKGGVTAAFVQQLDPATVPEPFDYRPVLLHVYHQREMRFDEANPMPSRQMVGFSQGAAPADLFQMPTEAVATKEDWGKFAAELKKSRNGAAATSNGDHSAGNGK